MSPPRPALRAGNSTYFVRGAPPPDAASAAAFQIHIANFNDKNTFKPILLYLPISSAKGDPMYFAKHFTRILSSLLAVSQLITVPVYAAFDSSFTYSYPVGAGLQYTRAEGVNNGGLQKANILTYTPNPDVTPIMSYADEKLYNGNATITNAVQYLQEQGKTAIGGANADFFVMSSGVPIGLVIDEGELISSDAWQYAIGFQKDGTAVIGQPMMGIHISGASGSVLVSYFNKTRTTAGAYLLDRHYDTSTHFSAHGAYIVLERLEDTPVQVNHAVSLKVVDKGVGDTPLTIADNQMILTKSDGADVPSWVDFPIGEEVTMQVDSGDARWNNVQYAVGGKLLIDNGSITTKGIDAGNLRRARSAAGVKEDGSVILYEIDGNQENHSAGLTAAELGTELKELGCVQAICLDGGGSSVMALRQPGESETVLLSSPSEGSERACANYIFFLSHIPQDGVTANAVLTPTYRYILPGASTTFTVKGADAAFYAAPAPQDLTYTVTGVSGTVEGQTFISAKEPGVAIITASNGDIEGSTMICVTESVTSIQLLHGENTLDALSLRAEQSVDLTAVPYHHNYRMAGVDTAFHWEVSGDIGSIDENGVFTAGLTMGAGTLTCSYGATKVTIPVHIGMGDPQQAITLADFETVQPFTAPDEISLTSITDLTEVARGTTSLQVFGQPQTFTLTAPVTDVTAMKYITLWARSENTQGELTAVFVSADGDELTAPFFTQTSSSWQCLTAEIPGGAQALTGLRFTGNHTEEAALYLDQIVLSARHVVTNTDAPQISFDEPVIADDGTVTLSGRAVMENELYPVRAANSIVRVDGKVLSEAVRMEQDRMTVATGALEPGAHCITVEVSDDAGNRARSSVMATIPGEKTDSDAFQDTNGHWAKDYASLLRQIGVLQGEVVNDVLYFRPNRNLRRVEFAVILARLLNLPSDDTAVLDFADETEIPNWAYDAVRSVVQAGLMNGKATANGQLLFAPNADMTRAEVMTVIGRTLPRGYTTSNLSYRDADLIPDWAKESLQLCAAAGIAGGYEDHTIRPLRPVTRGEIAKILTLTL